MEDKVKDLSSKIELIIQEYLIEEGILKQKVEDDNANFHYIIEYPENNSIDLIQPNGKNDSIIIGCATEISSEQRQLIQSSNLKVKQDLIWDIRFTINDFLLDFELYHPNNNLEKFVIIDEIYIDGLNKDRLISCLKKVFKVKLRCLWLIGRTFNNIILNNENKFNTKDNMFI